MKTKACLSLFTFSVVALVFMCALWASAQNQVAQQPTISSVPNLIRYGGVLKDADGTVLASKTVGVIFALYKQQDGGAPVWQETQNVRSDANGQYSVVLGSTTATGLPSDLFSQEEQRWLGVQMQGQAEQPRVLLVSVPYAFKAHEADTLGGLPPSAFVKAETVDASNGTSGSTSSTAGTTVSTAGPPVSTTAPAKAPKAPCVIMSNYIPVFSSTPPALCDSVIYQNPLNNNIGIGTANPTSKLDVNGNVNTRGVYKIGGNTVLNIVESSFIPPPPFQPLWSVFVGPGAGASQLSTAAFNPINTFVGGNAGFSTTVGGNNTFLGSGAGFSNTLGSFNTFLGDGAGSRNQTGSGATFVGVNAGSRDQAGINTFVGFEAGKRNTLGSSNTFVGYQAGNFNSCTADGCGFRNTFYGYQAGYSTTIGFHNVFEGHQAGYANDTGTNNVFVGDQAGYSNTSGDDNTFVGLSAGYSNTFGANNVSLGAGAGNSNTSGANNTFLGEIAGGALEGSNNTIVGSNALPTLKTGNNNIIVGSNAASMIIIPPNFPPDELHDTIYIGSRGGLEDVSGEIHIGDEGVHTRISIAGVFGRPVLHNATQVFVDQNGFIGSHPSSRRFKEQINDMGDSTNALMKLRPVTFLYKPEYSGDRTLQYGLIAEEVAKVYPELVTYDADGQPYSVQYQSLAPMLLNELQKQHTVVKAQQDVIKTQQQQILSLQQRLSRLEALVMGMATK